MIAFKSRGVWPTSLRKIALLGLALLVVAVCIHLISFSEESQRLASLCVGISAAKYPEASRFDGYCNDFNSMTVDSADGDELACLVQGGDYQLVQVIGIYRHGQRSPIHHVQKLSEVEEFACGLPGTGTEWSGLDDVVLKRLVENKQTGRTDMYSRVIFPLHPGVESTVCRLGQLTRAGFTQLAVLGDYFRHRYITSGVIGGLNGKTLRASNFVVRSTAVNRVMRSAAAFISGLHVGKEVTVLTHADMMFRALSPRLDASTFHGVDMKCASHARVVARSMFHSKDYRAMVNNVLEPVMRSFTKVLDVPRDDLPEITQLCDNMQSRHCARPNSAHLHCPDAGHCVTKELVRQALSACDAAFAMNFSLPYSLFLAHPLLQQIELHVEARLRQLEDHSDLHFDDSPFVLFFGHESTLVPILTALSSFDGVWPPFASRLLFEVWRCALPNCQLHKLRILYNGKPLQGPLTDVLGFIDFPLFQAFVAKQHAEFLSRCHGS